MASQGKPEAGAPAPAHSRTVTLWDPVVRLFHWALVISFAAWGLGKFGPDQMTLHFYAGYTIGALVVLRIIWGFVGPRPARFTSSSRALRRSWPMRGTCATAARRIRWAITRWARFSWSAS